MPETNFRALCAELTDTLENTWDGRRPKLIQEMLDRARAALAQPAPPTLKEQALRELADAYNRDKIDDTTYDTIRRALEALDD